MELTCPKCHSSMRSYERAGIVIDQCSECRGVYLDRGELEKLIDVETHGVAAPVPYGWQAPTRRDDRERDPRDRYETPPDGHYTTSRDRRRKRSFLEELFD
jgi:uncharacterized protein